MVEHPHLRYFIAGLDSGYLSAMLPMFVLVGLGFGLAFGPLNIAATSGVAADEQGLAGGLVNTSFQFGGALVLAVVMAVNVANTGPGGSPRALLDGFSRAGARPVTAHRERRDQRDGDRGPGASTEPAPG